MSKEVIINSKIKNKLLRASESLGTKIEIRDSYSLFIEYLIENAQNLSYKDIDEKKKIYEINIKNIENEIIDKKTITIGTLKIKIVSKKHTFYCKLVSDILKNDDLSVIYKAIYNYLKTGKPIILFGIIIIYSKKVEKDKIHVEIMHSNKTLRELNNILK